MCNCRYSLERYEQYTTVKSRPTPGLGSIRVERSQGIDPFERIWNDYYPEGYYPLEYPKVPQG